MSSRINLFKKGICITVIMVLMLTCFTSTALASNLTKTVTRERTYTFYTDYNEAANYLGSPRSYIPLTISYDDGIYKGTLNIATTEGYVSYVKENVLEVKIKAKYTGTVTAYITSKIVTYTSSYSYFVPYSINSNYDWVADFYLPTTYNYDDGTYKGILSLDYSYCVPDNKPIGNYIWVTVYASYSGMAYLK